VAPRKLVVDKLSADGVGIDLVARSEMVGFWIPSILLALVALGILLHWIFVRIPADEDEHG